MHFWVVLNRLREDSYAPIDDLKSATNQQPLINKVTFAFTAYLENILRDLYYNGISLPFAYSCL